MNSRDWTDGWERVLALSKTDSQGRAIEITDAEEKELKQLGRYFWGKETRGESSPKIKEQVQEMRLKLVKENIDAINKFLRKHKLSYAEFARLAGLSRTWYPTMVKDKTVVATDVADRLKEKFGLVLNSKRDYSKFRSRILRGESNE